jgi:hypothetical protein
MNAKTLRALVEAGAIKKVRIIANGSVIYLEAESLNSTAIAETNKGKPKLWSTIDSAAKWAKSLGIGQAYLDVSKWQPKQKSLDV